MTSLTKMLLVLAVLTANAGLTVGEEPVAEPERSTLPPSTNPTQRVIYPGEGQSEEQQMADQLECYRWASEQTGWDPYEAYDVLVEKGYAAAQAEAEAAIAEFERNLQQWDRNYSACMTGKDYTVN